MARQTGRELPALAYLRGSASGRAHSAATSSKASFNLNLLYAESEERTELKLTTFVNFITRYFELFTCLRESISESSRFSCFLFLIMF